MDLKQILLVHRNLKGADLEGSYLKGELIIGSLNK